MNTWKKCVSTGARGGSPEPPKKRHAPQGVGKRYSLSWTRRSPANTPDGVRGCRRQRPPHGGGRAQAKRGRTHAAGLFSPDAHRGAPVGVSGLPRKARRRRAASHGEAGGSGLKSIHNARLRRGGRSAKRK